MKHESRVALTWAPLIAVLIIAAASMLIVGGSDAYENSPAGGSFLSSESNEHYAFIDVSIDGEVKQLKYKAGKAITIEPDIDKVIDRGGNKYVLKNFTMNKKEFNFIGYVPKAGTTIQVEANYEPACIITLNYVSDKMDRDAVDYREYSNSHTYYAYVGENCNRHVATNDEQAKWFKPAIGYSYMFKGWFDENGNPWNWIATGNITLHADYESSLFPSYNPTLVTEKAVKDPVLFNVTTDEDGNLVYVYYIGTATDVLLGTYWEAYNSGGFTRSESEKETDIHSVSTYVVHTIETTNGNKITNTHDSTDDEKALLKSRNVKDPVSSGTNNTPLGIDLNVISTGVSTVGKIVSCIPGGEIAGAVVTGIGGVIGLAKYVSDATSDQNAMDRWERIIESTNVETVDSHEKTTEVMTSQGFKYAPVGSYLVYGVFGGVDYYQMEKYSPSGKYLGRSITYTAFDRHDAYSSIYCPNSPNTGADGFRVDLVKTHDISQDKAKNDLKKFLNDRKAILANDGSLIKCFDNAAPSARVNVVVDASSVKEKAFSGCTSMSSIKMPNVESIGKDAFSGCKSLAFISMPKIKSIGENAFNGCTGLITNLKLALSEKSIELEKDATHMLKVVGGSVSDATKAVWTSSDSSVASVSDGLVKAISGGTATIYAFVDGEKIASCLVNVAQSEEEENHDDGGIIGAICDFFGGIANAIGEFFGGIGDFFGGLFGGVVEPSTLKRQIP